MKILRRSVIFFHLVIVLFTVTHSHEWLKSPLVDAAVNVYSSVTYTNRCFGFFSPTVNDDLDVQFKVYRDTSTTYHLESLPQQNSETRMRVRTMYCHFAEDIEPSIMNLYARSWGLFFINSDTTIKKVDIVVMQNRIPSMDEYLKGFRIYQDSFYITSIEVNN